MTAEVPSSQCLYEGRTLQAPGRFVRERLVRTDSTSLLLHALGALELGGVRDFVLHGCMAPFLSIEEECQVAIQG